MQSSINASISATACTLVTHNVMTIQMVTHVNTFTEHIQYGISQMTPRTPYYSVKMTVKIVRNVMILFKLLRV